MPFCIDVLEHDEPFDVDAIVKKFARITTKLGFFTTHTGLSVEHFADALNARLI